MKKFEKQVRFIVDLYKSKNLIKAESLSRKLIKENPRVAILYNILGLVLTEQKKIDEALENYKKGIKVNPEFAMIYNNIGTLYRFKKDITKAELYYKKSINLNNGIAEPHNNLGNLYNSVNNFDKAIESFTNAISTDPRFFWAHYNLGLANTTIGNFDEAKKNLTECLKLNPNFYPAHRSLSRITKYSSQNKHFYELKSIYEDTKINSEKKKEIAFALGKASEDIEDFTNAFKYFKNGNDIHRKQINFSLEEEKNFFKEIKTKYNKELFKDLKESGFNNLSPIFIVGMPRSGTSLVEQILSSHKKVYGAGELDIIPDLVKKSNIKNLNHENLKSLGKEYIDNVKKISNNSPVITDKLPVNFRWIGFIKLILPNAIVINCVRNPKDNCFSIYKNFFAKSDLNFAYDLNEITEYYKLYINLMSYWKSVIPEFVINLNYEELINDSENQIKNLLKLCHLPWDPICLEFYKNKRPVKTASDTQIRKKIYTSSIDSWKNYSNDLNSYFKNL